MLSTNLTYLDSDTEKIAWKVNVESIRKNYYEVIGYENKGIYEGPMLVLQGEKSHRFKLDVFEGNFPKITQEDILVVDKAGK